MSNLALYKPELSELSEVAFVKHTPQLKKIRDIDSYEFTKQIGILMAMMITKAGIKGEIGQHDKQEIKELILMRFKNLSLNEIEYAFKLERFGVYDAKTEHYQLFNADYVSQILDKYIEWRRNVKVRHNISEGKKKVELSEDEKKYWRNRGVLTSLEHYKQDKRVPENYIYVYEILYEEYLPKDNDYKKKKYEDAKVALELEYSEKEATTREENQKIKKTIANLHKKGNEKVKMKAKELVLCEFYRKLLKDEKATSEFETAFNYKNLKK